jgi:thiol-disulfide isomerase/thioredoxin
MLTRRALCLGLTAATAILPAQQLLLKPVDESSYPRLISGFKGKVLLVDFWATWCVPCRAELPQLVKLQAKLKARGLEVITISADEPETVAAAPKFLKSTGADALPAYVKRAKDDDKFIGMLDPKWQGALPALFLYDKTGKKIQAFFGETPIAQIEAAITKLL